MIRLIDAYKCLSLTAIAGILAYWLWGKKPIRVYVTDGNVEVTNTPDVRVENAYYEPIPVQIERD